MSTMEWLGIFVGGAVLTLIAMNAPEWFSRANKPQSASPGSPPMSPVGKAQLKNAAWLLCAALLGGLVGGAVATRGPTTSTASHHEESEVDAAEISRLEDEISRLKSRVSDLEDKAR